MREKCLKYTAIVIMIMIFGIAIFYGKGAVRSAAHCLQLRKEGNTLEMVFYDFSNSYKSELTNSRFWINMYGGIQKLLGKREIKNFSVIRDKEGGLYSSIGSYTDQMISDSFEDIKRIYEKTAELEGDFLFVQMPYKSFAAAPELRTYKMDYTDDNFDRLYAKIEDGNIPAIDLRKLQTKWEYYKTDHHWTAESAFIASSYIIEGLNTRYHLRLDEKNLYRKRENYNTKVYKDALLGSGGIEVGEYYSGRDDVSIPVPKFETSLQWEHYIQGNKTAETSGIFWEAFIDETILNESSYCNKYNAFLNGGYYENRICNDLADNNRKLLLVTNSYGRPLVQYLSLYFKETRYLDPQPERYNGNYLEYIEEYKPDVVVVMYDDRINTQE